MARPKGRPKKAAGVGAQVRIDRDLATKARYVAHEQGITVLELLSGYIRSPLDRDFKKVAPQIGEGAK